MQSAPQNESTSGTVFLARFFWLFLGPMALFVLAAAIVNSGTGWATPLDAAFLIFAGLIMLARWYDLRSGEGRDVYGKPATVAAFPKYASWAIPTAFAVWVGANLLGNHVLKLVL
jgi:hypothetical protein